MSRAILISPTKNVFVKFTMRLQGCPILILNNPQKRMGGGYHPHQHGHGYGYAHGRRHGHGDIYHDNDGYDYDRSHHPSEQGRRLPASADDDCKFLMQWSNVRGSTFFEALRISIFKYNRLTPAQSEALSRGINDRRSPAAAEDSMFPYLSLLDPIHCKLLTLSETDISLLGESEHAADKDVILEFQQELIARGTLTYKQMRYLGGILHRNFPELTETSSWHSQSQSQSQSPSQSPSQTTEN